MDSFNRLNSAPPITHKILTANSTSKRIYILMIFHIKGLYKSKIVNFENVSWLMIPHMYIEEQKT